jgi:hypothetical protein
MLLNILFYIVFGMAAYNGIMSGRKKMNDTRLGLLPSHKSDDSNDYFFLVYHD